MEFLVKLLVIVLAMSIWTSCDASSSQKESKMANAGITNLPTNRPDESEIQTSNETRLKVGIRRIKPDWYLYRNRIVANEVTERHEEWKKPGQEAIVKCIIFQNEQAVLERDNYYTGDTFSPVDPDVTTDFEKLVIEYNYKTERVDIMYVGSDKSISNLIGEDDWHLGEKIYSRSNADSLIVAKKILKKWGLKIDE